ncbi:MAG: hypothetical protein ACOCR6_01055 [archaeon]
MGVQIEQRAFARLSFPLSIVGVSIADSGLFLAASVSLGLFTVFWFLRGIVYYGNGHITWRWRSRWLRS